MTGVKQTYSRDYKIAIDTLTIGCQVRKKKRKRAKDEYCFFPRLVATPRGVGARSLAGGLIRFYPSRSRVVVQSSKKNTRFLEL